VQRKETLSRNRLQFGELQGYQRTYSKRDQANCHVRPYDVAEGNGWCVSNRGRNSSRKFLGFCTGKQQCKREGTYAKLRSRDGHMLGERFGAPNDPTCAQQNRYDPKQRHHHSTYSTRPRIPLFQISLRHMRRTVP
jgi:hypothetical protein